jgi:hypothetical protein
MQKPLSLQNEGKKTVVFIPIGRLRKQRYAVLYFEDYLALVKNGLTPNWSAAGKGYVVAPNKEKTQYIARVLLSAREKERISYKDGNPFNLRRENLVLRKSRSLALD